jgi:hypothetical protein
MTFLFGTCDFLGAPGCNRKSWPTFARGKIRLAFTLALPRPDTNNKLFDRKQVRGHSLVSETGAV